LRNRLKRLIRESFRQDQTALAGFDIVVVARPAARGAERAALCASLQQHWKVAR
jgi:ribonuclease P protein component